MDTNSLLGDEARATAGMATAQRLGFTRVRLSASWSKVARFGGLPARPVANLRDPASYPADAWEPIDRAVRLAVSMGLGVHLNISGFAPPYATEGEHERERLNLIWEIDEADFGDFAAAVGRRYDGTYVPPGAAAPLPRVSFWSLYNEPNQPGWLAPQSRIAPVAGRDVTRSAVLYRKMVYAAYDGLLAMGHGADEVLIGELAPSGHSTSGTLRAVRPGVFTRALLCLDRALRPLRGRMARALECEDFRRLPGTGFAHHPYDLRQAPDQAPVYDDDITLASLDRLEEILDAGAKAGRLASDMPIWDTEYGWETAPDKGRGIPLGRHLGYMMRAEFLHWRNPRVRSVGQYQLEDEPVEGTPGTEGRASWQSGLLTATGDGKPAAYGFQTPIQAGMDKGGFFVWGMVRPGAGTTRTVQLEVQPSGGTGFVAQGEPFAVNGRGYFLRRTQFVAGRWRFAWLDSPAGIRHSPVFRVRSRREAVELGRPLPPTTGRIRSGRDRVKVDSTIRRPACRKRGRRRCDLAKRSARVISGRARGDVSRVQIALLRVYKGTRRNAPRKGERPIECVWLRDTRGQMRTKRPTTTDGCRTPVWVDVDGRRAWKLRLRRLLPRGGYILFTRAVAWDSSAESSFTRRDRNRLSFRIK